jgi:hypothetical protein
MISITATIYNIEFIGKGLNIYLGYNARKLKNVLENLSSTKKAAQRAACMFSSEI